MRRATTTAAARLLSGAIAGAALLATGPLAGVGCDVNGLSVTQYYDEDTGEALDSTAVDLMQDDDPPVLVEQTDGSWPAPFVGELGPVHWGSGATGGATASFVGTGGEVCIILDPQTVWRDDWVMTSSGTASDATMENYIHDDGDADLLVGLSADYTGTPGESMGTFQRTFVDPNGVERQADFNQCIQYDYWGLTGGNAGRATPEWCTIETVEDVEYTVAILTFSTPLDDDWLRFALQMRIGACPSEVDECTLRGDADPHDIVITVGSETFSYDDLEERFCDPDHI